MIVRDFQDVERSAMGVKWDITGTSDHDGTAYYNVVLRSTGKPVLIKVSDYKGTIYYYRIPTYRIGDASTPSRLSMHRNHMSKLCNILRSSLAANGGWMTASELGKIIGEDSWKTSGLLRGMPDVESVRVPSYVTYYRISRSEP